MTGFVVDGQPWETPDRAAQPGYAATPLAGGGLAADALAFGSIVTGRLQQYGIAIKGGGNGANLPPDPILQADEANKAFAPPGTSLFSHQIATSTARDIGKEAADQAKRDLLLTRWAGQANPFERIGILIAASLLDPTNIAAAFIPGIGEETFLASLGKAGVTGFGARVASRAMSGAATFAAATPVFMGLQAGQAAVDGQQFHFDIRDSLNELAMNAAVGALLHTGAGFLVPKDRAWLLTGARDADFARPEPVPEKTPAPTTPEVATRADEIARAPAPTTKAALDTAVAQTLDGRPVDVGPIFDATRSAEPSVPAAIEADVRAAEAGVEPNGPEGTQGRPETTAAGPGVGTSPQPGQAPQAGAVATAAVSREAPVAAQAPTISEQPVRPLVGGGEPPKTGLVVAAVGSDGKIYYGKPGQLHFHLSEEFPHSERGDWKAVGFSGPDGSFLTREQALQALKDGGKSIRSSIGDELDALDMREQIPVPAAQPKTTQEVAAGQQQLYRNGFAPGVDQTEFDATNAAVYGQERAPSAHQPPPSATTKAPSAEQAAIDQHIADAERQIADSGIALTAEERGELNRSQAAVTAADQAADGYSQAGDCLTAAGV